MELDHRTAVVNHMAEAYVLDELSPEQRDAYEDHFFNCTACAEEISVTADFVDAARMVMKVQNALARGREKERPHSTGFWSRLSRLLFRILSDN